MSGISQNQSYNPAPIGARLPAFLSSQPGAADQATTAYNQDQLNLVGGAGEQPGNPAAIQAGLTNPDPRVRFQAVIDATKLPPQQAIPLLQMAASNDNPQVVQLAQRALAVMQQMPGAAPQQPQPNQYQPQPQPNPYQQQQPNPYQQQPNPYQQQQPQPTYQPPAAQQYTPPPPGQQTMPFDAWFFNAQLQTGGDADKVKVIQQLDAYRDSNRQDVLNIALRTMNAGDVPSLPNTIMAAMQLVRNMKAQEAKPYLLAIVNRSAMVNKPVADMAAQILGELDGGVQTAGVNGGQPFNVYVFQQRMTTGTEDERARATMELQNYSQTNREDVKNMLLRAISREGQGPQAQTLAAISVLRQMREPSAVPYLRALMMNSVYSNQAIYQAAMQAMGELSQVH